MQRTSFEDMTCSVAQCLDVVGEWWSLLIVRDAFLGVTRFDDFQARLGISRNILARRLNHLVGSEMDAVAALDPTIVVAGHKSVGAPDLPESIAASQQYLRDFSRIVNEQESVEDIVAAMLELHGDRDNPRVLWHSARTAVAKRG